MNHVIIIILYIKVNHVIIVILYNKILCFILRIRIDYF